MSFNTAVKGVYESVNSENMPNVQTRSTTLNHYETAINAMINDLTGKTGITRAATSTNPSNVFNIIHSTSLKSQLMEGNSICIFNNTTVPFWISKSATILFGGANRSSGGNENNTAKLQGDLAYDALKARCAYELARNMSGKGTQATALLSDYNTKVAKIYAT